MTKVIPILQLRPSKAGTWLSCAASPLLERDEPDTSSGYADEGTAAHFLAATCLLENVSAESYFGWSVVVQEGLDQRWVAPTEPLPTRGPKLSCWMVTREMAAHVQGYLDHCRRQADGADAMLVEQRIDLSEVFDLPGAKGTADCVVIDGDMLHVIDLKYGQGVAVDVEDNEQLMIYAAGAVREHSMLNDFKRVTLHIYQPRIDNVSTWEFGIEKLQAFEARVKRQVQTIRDIYDTEVYGPDDFGPSEKSCKWCKAKPCQAMEAKALQSMKDDFDDLSNPVDEITEATERVALADNARLGVMRAALPYVKLWMTAVEDKVAQLLSAGEAVPGWKLVEGRQGNRTWADEKEAEATLKAMRLKDEVMYDFKLISPTTAEKLAKDKTIGPRQWPKLQSLISRADGKPTVAPESDKRPAVVAKPAIDEFEDLDDLI